MDRGHVAVVPPVALDRQDPRGLSNREVEWVPAEFQDVAMGTILPATCPEPLPNAPARLAATQASVTDLPSLLPAEPIPLPRGDHDLFVIDEIAAIRADHPASRQLPGDPAEFARALASVVAGHVSIEDESQELTLPPTGASAEAVMTISNSAAGETSGRLWDAAWELVQQAEQLERQGLYAWADRVRGLAAEMRQAARSKPE